MAVRQHAIVKDFELGQRSLTKRGLGDFARQLVVLGLLELGLNVIRVSGYIFEPIILFCKAAGCSCILFFV